MTRLLGLWCWVIDDDEGEAVVVLSPPGEGNVFVPLVGDADRVEQWRPAAQGVANSTGKPVRLIQFINRVDRDTLNPQQGDPP